MTNEGKLPSLPAVRNLIAVSLSGKSRCTLANKGANHFPSNPLHIQRAAPLETTLNLILRHFQFQLGNINADEAENKRSKRNQSKQTRGIDSSGNERYLEKKKRKKETIASIG